MINLEFNRLADYVLSLYIACKHGQGMETLYTRQEYTLDGMAVHCRETYTYIFTPVGDIFHTEWHTFGRKPEFLKENHANTGET